MGKIIKYKDQSGVEKYPLTVSRAVYHNDKKLSKILNNNELLMIGDSLVQGQGTGKNITEYLSALLPSWTLINKGGGGDKITDIMARQGCAPAISTQSFTIPASGSVEIGNTSHPLISSFDGTRKINFLLQNIAVCNPVKINGVLGNLSVSGWYETATYSFTRIIDGDILFCQKFTPIYCNESFLESEVTLIWGGTNGLWANEDDLISRIKSMVEFSKSKKILIIGLTNNNYYYNANTHSEFDYTILTQKMYKAFGSRYVDTLGYLLNNALADAEITPTEADTTAISQEKVPTSLLTDAVHFNTIGYELIANLIYNKGKAIGYW